MNEDMWIVPKIDEGLDPSHIRCTTYQMRNPCLQFKDAVAGELDMHCYLQHQYAAELCNVGDIVLDVCCGRGLMIPFLRYHASPSMYVGVDIERKNARWVDGRDPRNETNVKTDWGFSRKFVLSDCAEMSDPVLKATKDTLIDVVVFTSSIEHMQPDAQRTTLQECAAVSHSESKLFLTCPVSEEEHDQYETQYAAHVYEPTQQELHKWLNEAGWEVKHSFGICAKMSKVREVLSKDELDYALSLRTVMPRMQFLTAISVIFPSTATEMAYVCERS